MSDDGRVLVFFPFLHSSHLYVDCVQVTAAASDLITLAIQISVQKGVHQVEQLLDHATHVARDLATKRVLMSIPAWAGRSNTFHWVEEMYCAADPALETKALDQRHTTREEVEVILGKMMEEQGGGE
jgi:hypothetical protein